MPHIIRKPGILGGTTLAVFMTLVHTVNDATTAILGALLPTLQVEFDASPTTLALMVSVFWIASCAPGEHVDRSGDIGSHEPYWHSDAFDTE
jgi:hypothetical protein